MPAAVIRPTDRLVLWLHRPLDGVTKHWAYDAKYNPIAHLQEFAHHAIFVAPLGLSASQINENTPFTLFELALDKDNNAVALSTRNNQATAGWKGVTLFTGIGSDIIGVTSLSDAEIAGIGWRLIHDLGSYDVLVNNCQLFASSLHLEICNVKCSKLATAVNVEQKLGKKLQGKSWMGTFVKAVVLEAVLGISVDEMS